MSRETEISERKGWRGPPGAWGRSTLCIPDLGRQSPNSDAGGAGGISGEKVLEPGRQQIEKGQRGWN